MPHHHSGGFGVMGGFGHHHYNQGFYPHHHHHHFDFFKIKVIPATNIPGFVSLTRGRAAGFLIPMMRPMVPHVDVYNVQPAPLVTVTNPVGLQYPVQAGVPYSYNTPYSTTAYYPVEPGYGGAPRTIMYGSDNALATSGQQAALNPPANPEYGRPLSAPPAHCYPADNPAYANTAPNAKVGEALGFSEPPPPYGLFDPNLQQTQTTITKL